MQQFDGTKVASSTFVQTKNAGSRLSAQRLIAARLSARSSRHLVRLVPGAYITLDRAKVAGSSSVYTKTPGSGFGCAKLAGVAPAEPPAFKLTA